MKRFLPIIRYLIFLLPFLLISCGDNDGVASKLTKGHRDAIKIQCEDASNKEACNQEVRANFVSDGNEYADFSELTKDQIDSVKWNCNRSRKYGLEAYNKCLEKFIDKALGGTLFDDQIAKKPESNIEKLEQSVVYIEMVLTNFTKKEEYTFGSGSGVIISNKEIATNCHVALAEPSKDDLKSIIDKLNWNKSSDDLDILLWIRLLNGEDWANATLSKKAEGKDICILKHNPKDLFKVSMKPIDRFLSFKKLKKGSFVRAMGSPGGLIGHTSTGDIQWLGDATELGARGFDDNTKFIVHGAKIHSGSSGGPLFNEDGYIIGLNTLISDTAAENIAVSADHITDLLYDK